MANSAGVCVQFKVDLFMGVHNFTQGGPHTFKMALFQTTANLSPSTRATYSSTNEVAASGDYSTGGQAVTNARSPAASGNYMIWTPTANVAWTGITATTDCAELYNSSAANKSVALFTFGTVTVGPGNFTLTMPTNDTSYALLRMS